MDNHEQDGQEEPILKIVDKRKFHEDGTLRDGVVIQEKPPKAAPRVSQEAAPVPAPAPQKEESREAQTPPETSEDELLNDKNPASFVNFLSTLVANAAASLGAVPHPATGQKSVDLETGKYWIDVMLMLKEKTIGNLNSQEQKLMDGIVSDLQMQFLAISRAADDKLKSQAAQKFTSKDVLGG